MAWIVGIPLSLFVSERTVLRVRIVSLTVTPSNTSAPDPNKVFASAVEMTRNSLSVGIRFAASMGPFAILNAVESIKFLSGTDAGSSVTTYNVPFSA